MASLAGFGRDRALEKTQKISGGFLGGLIMTVIAGILSSFINFAFIYSQDPIVAQFSQVQSNSEVTVTVPGNAELSGKYLVGGDGTIDLKSQSVVVGGMSASAAAQRIADYLQEDRSKVRLETGSIPANFAVWAVGLLGGALINLGYAAYLLGRNRSWNVLVQSGGELFLATIIGINFSLAVTLMGKGMLLLGRRGHRSALAFSKPCR